jgi:hypothetical protein
MDSLSGWKRSGLKQQGFFIRMEAVGLEATGILIRPGGSELYAD